MEKQQANEKLAWMLQQAKKMAMRYGMIGIHDSDDIAQNAMIYLLKKKDCLELGNGFIAKVVRSHAFDALRRLSREEKRCVSPVAKQTDLQIAESCDFDENSADFVPDNDLRMDLKEALLGLKEPLMKTLWLFAQGYSCQEIARMTKTNSATVRTRLHYGRKAAQRLLIEAGIVDRR